MHKVLASRLTVVSAVAIALCLAANSGLARSPLTGDMSDVLRSQYRYLPQPEAIAGEPSTTLHEMTVAEGEATAPEPAPSEGGADPAGVLKPKTYPETPAEVSECMKSWDPQTGMSKEEYEQSCQRTLKYFPEKPN